jgi:hypothetical protein
LDFLMLASTSSAPVDRAPLEAAPAASPQGSETGDHGGEHGDAHESIEVGLAEVVATPSRGFAGTLSST